MTDRAEIECLLNQTGRTLEGLPTQDEYWYSDDYVDRNEEIAMMMYRSGFKRNEPYIMYQSDVIELLVGALRDALDKPMQKPLTLRELWDLGRNDDNTFVWEERRNPDNFAKMLAGGLAIRCLDARRDPDLAFAYTYNVAVRAWRTLPTDEERNAAAWEN